MSDPGGPNASADLAAFSVMRVHLRSRTEGTEAVRSDVRGIIDHLEERFGRDAVITLVGSLAMKALAPFEDHARRAGTEVSAELDADEQRVLALLDEHRRGSSGT